MTFTPDRDRQEEDWRAKGIAQSNHHHLNFQWAWQESGFPPSHPHQH